MAGLYNTAATKRVANLPVNSDLQGKLRALNSILADFQHFLLAGLATRTVILLGNSCWRYQSTLHASVR